MSVTEEKKIIAKSALHSFGGTPSVYRCWDDNRNSHVDLVTCKNRPYEGINSSATIGLSDFSIGYSAGDVPLRTEIVGAANSEFEWFPNVLSTCAFNVINSQMECGMGKIHHDVIEMYYPSFEMKHILFVPPFLWEESLKTIDFPDKKVAWLMAIPISENEYRYAKEKGSEALEDLFEKKEIDFYDLKRKSVV
ncbi:suppressor of fused domain protein [Marininema halotolerans]|uniref:Suppressor of fused protein (SUFU) n=1 Tax=Marininema halotolerans TaxID=1155944 RepID=A0A1I6UM32_9BACL|nr:suppressor of fused domain protein [Marininema halotolerans]SFT02500.1 Suppressor of fused protein (SUFU) [Marininema halotolerans]